MLFGDVCSCCDSHCLSYGSFVVGLLCVAAVVLIGFLVFKQAWSKR